MKTANREPSSKTIKKRRPIQRRRLAGVTISIQRCRSGPHTARVVIRSGGKQRTKGFETAEAARAYADLQVIEAGNTGARAATEIGDTERLALLKAKEALAPFGKTLRDAVTFYVSHLTTAARSATVKEVADAFLKHRKDGKKSKAYLNGLTVRLRRITRDFGDRVIGALTSDEMTQWLVGLNQAPASVNGFRTILSLLFHFGHARGFCRQDIMRLTPHMTTSQEEPGILTVAESAALLNAADSRIRAALVIGLFCGVRDAEIYRLDWRAVDFENDTLVIDATIAKRRQRRVIPIQENARMWLEPLRQIGGPIIRRSKDVSALIFAARRAAGIGSGTHNGIQLRPWPSNALRHSFASYALAKWQDAAALAVWMGNSPGIILEHYKALVKPAAAEAFWKLTPDTAPARGITTIQGKAAGEVQSKSA